MVAFVWEPELEQECGMGYGVWKWAPERMEMLLGVDDEQEGT